MSTTSLTERTIGQLAVEMPIAIRVFEAWKIDYCCGGKTPLSQAVEAAGKTVEAFQAELDRLAMAPADGFDWPSQTMPSMARKIVATYHDYTRQELQTIDPMAAKVLSVHGERRPELAAVVALIRDLTGDMLPHMLKEEQVLFPYVDQMVEAAAGHRDAPAPFFGTVKNPIRMMMLEHDRVGEILAKLREVSEDYTPPSFACFSYRELYRRLAELETRTHEHIHVENNLYFPRAIALEDNAAAPDQSVAGCGMSGCGH